MIDLGIALVAGAVEASAVPERKLLGAGFDLARRAEVCDRHSYGCVLAVDPCGIDAADHAAFRAIANQARRMAERDGLADQLIDDAAQFARVTVLVTVGVVEPVARCVNARGVTFDDHAGGEALGALQWAAIGTKDECHEVTVIPRASLVDLLESPALVAHETLIPWPSGSSLTCAAGPTI